MRESEYLENTVLGKKLTKDAFIPALIARILKIAEDDHFELDASSHMGWQDMKIREIVRLTKILRKKIKYLTTD